MLSGIFSNRMGIDIGKFIILFYLYLFIFYILLGFYFYFYFQVAQSVRPKIEDTGLWEFARVFAQAYDYGMGVVLFAPIASLVWLPIISAFQTRFLFNEAFNGRLQIQPILPGKKKQT